MLARADGEVMRERTDCDKATREKELPLLTNYDLEAVEPAVHLVLLFPSPIILGQHR